MDETVAILMAIAFVLAIILAVVGRSSLISILLIGIVLVVVGVLIQFGVMPSIDAHLNVSVENPEAAIVLVGIVALYAVLVGAYYLWKRQKSEEEDSSDTPPPMPEEWTSTSLRLPPGPEHPAPSSPKRKSDIPAYVGDSRLRLVFSWGPKRPRARGGNRRVTPCGLRAVSSRTQR